MHIVVIHGWQEVTAELTQTLAEALGILVFEARQRLAVGSPAVIAGFAESQPAQDLTAKLRQCGVSAETLDTVALLDRSGHIEIRRFVLHDEHLQLEAFDGATLPIPYGEIELLLPGIAFSGGTESRTVSERKFSLGKTLLAGGVPMTKKVERQETVASEGRQNLLHLYAGERPAVVFSQRQLNYDGLGAAMQLSAELNFAALLRELRQRSPAARCDERLLTHAGQLRLLGPAHNLGQHLELAAAILARVLRRGTP